MPETPGRKLKLFQRSDPLKFWYSLGEQRWCKRCERLFTGFDIRLIEDNEGIIHFRCPTLKCESSWPDWEYPELHL